MHVDLKLQFNLYVLPDITIQDIHRLSTDMLYYRSIVTDWMSVAHKGCLIRDVKTG